MKTNKSIKFFLIVLYILFFVSLGLAEIIKGFSYENEAMGVKITGPEDWYIVPGEKAQEKTAKNIDDITKLESLKESSKKVGILVVFLKYPYGSPREFNPNIVLATEKIISEYAGVLKTPLDVANANIITLKMMFKDVKIIEGPMMVKLESGLQGAHFIYEAKVVRGYLEVGIRCSVYIFLKDDIIYTLTFTDRNEDFENNIKAFESSLKTFVLK